MFSLVEFTDSIRIPPELFCHGLQEALTYVLNDKMANKVMLHTGLCITLKEIVHIGDSIIIPGDGSSHTKVTFRFIVFRPQIGYVITGKIRSSDREGLYVTLGFFDDIFIPSGALPNPSRFLETEQTWVWEYPLPDGEKHDLYMDIGETIRFRVEREFFAETLPGINPQINSDGQQTDMGTPYKIQGTINDSGLGVVRWWTQEESQEAEDDNFS